MIIMPRDFAAVACFVEDGGQIFALCAAMTCSAAGEGGLLGAAACVDEADRGAHGRGELGQGMSSVTPCQGRQSAHRSYAVDLQGMEQHDVLLFSWMRFKLQGFEFGACTIDRQVRVESYQRRACLP